MHASSSQTIERYEAVIIKQLPTALRIYSMQQAGDPAFFSSDLKHKDMLHEFRYMLMMIAYSSPHEEAREFWQRFQAQAASVSLPHVHDLKREVLVNVAIARAFDRLKVKFWWTHAEDNDMYRLTFRFMDGSFAYAVASKGDLEVIRAKPQTNAPREKHPDSLQAIANRLYNKGYYFMIPDSSYDGTTGEPSAQLVKRVAQLKLPPLEQWHAELQKLQDKPHEAQ